MEPTYHRAHCTIELGRLDPKTMMMILWSDWSDFLRVNENKIELFLAVHLSVGEGKEIYAETDGSGVLCSHVWPT